MDRVTSHISGWFFFDPVAHFPLYISIILLVSWGPPARHWEAYIRPSEDVTATGHSSKRTSPNLNRRSQFLRSSWKQQVWPATGVSACLRLSTSSAVLQHGHVSAGVSSRSGCCDGWRHPGSSHPRQSGQGWPPARIWGEDGWQPAGDGENLKKSPILFHFTKPHLRKLCNWFDLVWLLF